MYSLLSHKVGVYAIPVARPQSIVAYQGLEWHFHRILGHLLPFRSSAHRHTAQRVAAPHWHPQGRTCEVLAGPQPSPWFWSHPF